MPLITAQIRIGGSSVSSSCTLLQLGQRIAPEMQPTCGLGLRLRSMEIFLVATTILLALVVTVLCIGVLVRYEVSSDISDLDSVEYWSVDLPVEQQRWYDDGIAELKAALHIRPRRSSARNVVVFVVAGIGPAALAAARDGGGVHEQVTEQVTFSWDRFPHHGRLKNSCSGAVVCDPYTVGTALYGGVKTNFQVGGLDAAVNYRNCTQASAQVHQVPSVMQYAQAAGMRTGLVTTGRMTGPSVAALYAHTPDTSWECDGAMPFSGPLTQGCLDTAQQLVNGTTGINLNVVLGGGRQTLVGKPAATRWDPIDELACRSERLSNRNLVRDWRLAQLSRRRTVAVLKTRNELRRLNGSTVDYALGVFANGDLQPMKRTKKGQELTPTLHEMTQKALDVLARDKVGYLLLVETGVERSANISDKAHLLLALNGVIESTLNSSRSDSTNTLTLVVFTEGNYIRNAIDSSAEMHTITDFQGVGNDEALLRRRLLNFPGDLLVFAEGPRAYLFHGVHEETYMAHVISYALRMGHFTATKPKRNPNGGQ